MMRTLAAGGKRDRSLAQAILVAAVVLVVAAIALPVWMLHRHYDSAGEDLADKLARYQRIAATRGQVQQALDTVRAKEPRRFYLKAVTAPLAGAEVQDLAKALIESNGGKVITAQAGVPREEGRYRQVSVNLQFTANMVSLRRILNAMETGLPYLFVDNVVIRSQVPATFKPAPGGEPEMFVQFDVIGYTLGAN